MSSLDRLTLYFKSPLQLFSELQITISHLFNCTHVVCGHEVQVVVVAGVEGHDVVNGFVSGQF